jgi:hypothetical protein
MTSPLPNMPIEPVVLIPMQQLLKGCHQNHLSDPLEKIQTYKQRSCLPWKQTWRWLTTERERIRWLNDEAAKGSTVGLSQTAKQLRLEGGVVLVS